jgi:hypothetical protein
MVGLKASQSSSTWCEFGSETRRRYIWQFSCCAPLQQLTVTAPGHPRTSDMHVNKQQLKEMLLAQQVP